MNIVQTICCCGKKNTGFWRGAGIVIGWISLIVSTWLIYEILLAPKNQCRIVSIIYIILVLFLDVNHYICKYATIFLCVINWLTCVLWLYGINKNIKECMLASLVWWGTELGFFIITFCIMVLFFGSHTTDFNISTWAIEHFCFVISTVLFVLFYITALICFESIEHALYQIKMDVPNGPHTSTTSNGCKEDFIQQNKYGHGELV